MRPDMFGYPVEVFKYEDDDWPFIKFEKKKIIQMLCGFFGHTEDEDTCFEFYQVNRPGWGIDRPITVLANPKKEYYTVRIFTKPDKEVRHAFNPATYRKDRVQRLFDSLREHYPATYFLGSKSILIILQRFIFHPVCKFSRAIEITGLLEIVWYASRGNILLDYNHNHWLVSESGELFYVDTDFMGHVLPNRLEALSENFNQSMVFFNDENCHFLHRVLPEFATRGEDYYQFVEEFLIVLNNYLASWKRVEKISDTIQYKLNCLQDIVDASWTG